MIKQELLEIIACPKCKGTIQLNEEKSELICHVCQLAYEIREEIPIMLIDEAKPLLEQQPS
ncbi:MAG: Trm112 family protein [Candidatus Electrothrix sp. AR4]|nr:Trm112 family protein [Candidatus Electrothrix sp. AR4]